MRPPVEYIYLDHQSIESLYAQIVDRVETSRVTTIQKGLGAKGHTRVRLKNLLVKLLSGLQGEASAEVTGSRMRTEQATSRQAIEQKLGQILVSLGKLSEGYFFTSLAEATRHVQTTNESTFINIREKFNAPQFYGSGIGIDRVNAAGYLLLEKGGALDYNENDNYYRQPATLVKLSANIKKMRAKGMMGASSHEAVLFRGFAGRAIPLYVFGTLSSACDYLQIKPFAIWK